jgi:hypothetical protein
MNNSADSGEAGLVFRRMIAAQPIPYCDSTDIL